MNWKVVLIIKYLLKLTVWWLIQVAAILNLAAILLRHLVSHLHRLVFWNSKRLRSFRNQFLVKNMAAAILNLATIIRRVWASRLHMLVSWSSVDWWVFKLLGYSKFLVKILAVAILNQAAILLRPLTNDLHMLLSWSSVNYWVSIQGLNTQ